MASPKKSPQHEKAHSPKTPSQYPKLEITNNIDVASFVGGITSSTPIKESYYNCRFESSQHKSFYLILEATRRVNKAVLTYKGRKADIKRASGTISAIYLLPNWTQPVAKYKSIRTNSKTKTKADTRRK